MSSELRNHLDFQCHCHKGIFVGIQGEEGGGVHQSRKGMEVVKGK
jgi:hypothetical protein